MGAVLISRSQPKILRKIQKKIAEIYLRYLPLFACMVTNNNTFFYYVTKPIHIVIPKSSLGGNYTSYDTSDNVFYSSRTGANKCWTIWTSIQQGNALVGKYELVAGKQEYNYPVCEQAHSREIPSRYQLSTERVSDAGPLSPISRYKDEW